VKRLKKHVILLAGLLEQKLKSHTIAESLIMPASKIIVGTMIR
jgi:hypothetical protein